MFEWENAIALHAMQGNLASSRGEGKVSWLFSSCGRHLGYILELRRGWAFETRVCSANLWWFLKGVKPLVPYDEDRGMVIEPMLGKLASSQFDLGHSDLFCVPEVTSVFFSSCDSVVGDFLEFNQANRGSLCV